MSQIVLCPRCGGRGYYTEEFIRLNNIRGKNICCRCKGDGRMLKVIVYERVPNEKLSS